MTRLALPTPKRCLLAACLLAATAAITGCPGPSPTGASHDAKPAAALDPILAAPKTGDVYAAEISHFSGADYSYDDGDGADEKTFGLMKVIAVSPKQVTAVTETSGWPKGRGAINDLRGDMADIEWDDEEKIQILRSELPELVASERILEARRPGVE